MKRLFLLGVLFLTMQDCMAQQDNSGQKEEVKKVPTLQLYPKTADKSLNIYVELPQPTDIVVSMPGTERNNPVSWEMNARSSYQKSIDVSTLPEGLYTIKVAGKGVALEDSFTIKRH